MGGRITGFFREFVLAFSIILTILGIIVIFIGATAIWFKDIPEDLLNLSKDFLFWKEYLLIIGFIIFAAGIWYLYSYLKNRKFILEEIKTNKRSELLKKHGELKNTVRHMPSKYQRMLEDKEEELKI
ncbi:MAG: hypothetical protein KAR55_04700 [Thermoplasmatales archaeon]|nr:hypothetical protein [Thermoplasmatales archaeon]